MHHLNTCPTIYFHVFKMFSLCKVHGRRTPDKRKFSLCAIVPQNAPTEKLYTIKYLVNMDTYIADFHTGFYIP